MHSQGCTCPNQGRQIFRAHHGPQYSVYHSRLRALATATSVDAAVDSEQQQVDASQRAAAPVAEGNRRRRRVNSHARDNKQALRNPRIPTYELFQQHANSPKQGVVVGPASSATSLPPEALADPTEALNPGIRRVRRSTYSSVEQRLAAQFQPFRDSFQHVALQLSARQQQQQLSSPDTAAGAAAVDAPSGDGSDRGIEKISRQSRRANRLTQLFSVPAEQIPSPATATMSTRRVALGSPDVLAQQPAESRQAVQRLANILIQQQGLHKQQKQQQQQQQQQDEAGQRNQQHDGQEYDPAIHSRLRPARIVSPSASQMGATRLYMPAPSASEATSPADRQPLQLLSVRQLQHMQQEARQQAIKRIREKSITDYQAVLDQMLTWQGTGQYTYYPRAPRFLPVALQRTWVPSSSNGRAPSEAAADTAEAADSQQPSASDVAAIRDISAVVCKQLGPAAALPDRAYKGERGLYIASLSPQAVTERLRRWISCCGSEFVAQLVMREPCLLGLEPRELLTTLEALNSTLQLPTQACVEYVSRNVVVIGLDAAELRDRVQRLADAGRLHWEDAVKLAQSKPQLLMVHPSHIEGQMAALRQLLPEAAPKLSAAVKRNSFLLLKSPRAVARGIQELAEALGLSAWAGARLVAGQPSILNSNFDVLQRRLVRLQDLTSVSKRWQRELQALSPPLLARCLVCTDATIERLALLTEVGAAGKSRLPPIHLILTTPEAHFQEVLEDMAQRKLRRQQLMEQKDRGEYLASHSTAGSGTRGRESVAFEHAAASRRPSQKLTPRVGRVNGRQTAQQRAFEDDDDDADVAEDLDVQQGVLGGDMSWRRTLSALAEALQQSVAAAAGGRGTKAGQVGISA